MAPPTRASSRRAPRPSRPAAHSGVTSTLTQTFGLGLDRPPDAAALEDPLALLNGRGSAPIELTDVMYLPLSGPDEPTPGPAGTTSIVGTADAAAWVAAGCSLAMIRARPG